MLSVIELAQLLTGALDQRFNIINKAAVVQVVSCLEAFNLTQESFQEFQNTRIIKDLQALRQNKANDQALAKRIKNILRKWKERLAVAPSAQSSQPNSPQNFSQGSSDTQFMTQQSQSPPISQLPNHQRAVNGPISFTNLLPKPQPPLHLHVNILKPMTSPAPVPYQNGTASSQESLLGKRKLDAPAVVGADVDENSNHSRNKKMKKFHSTAIASPLSLNPNNSSINHNHLINPPIPTVPAQQPPEEAPKKRGRKKGSKGVDSMLNGFVPDFQTDIQQKIALSAGKRNKTTVELQQMLESHQNTAMSWTNGDVDSSSLDRGFNSSSFQPAESTVASQGDDFQRKIKQEINGESFFDAVPSTSSHHAANTRSLNIEDEIAELRAKLPPIDYEAAERETFDEYCPVNDYGEPVECTCTFREMITYAEPEENAAAAVNGFPAPPPVVVKNGVSEKPEDSDDDETDDFCAVEDDDDLASVKSPPPVRGAVKSIFDPEYDANENLIEEMVRRKPRDNASKVIEVKIEKAAVKPMRIEPLLMPEPVPEVERVPIINYECVEDEDCPAREHFKRDPVTKDDVLRIHRTFVHGVNGFWNGILEEKPQHDYSKDMENIDYARHQLWKRVVPRYDFLTCDKIPKTFGERSSDSNSPPKSKPPPPPLDDDGNEDSKPFNGARTKSDKEFREWHELMNVRSYNDDVLTILPYVIID